ncbi:Wadjet anti-phage system protein JetD domain-containing protein [Brevibacillus sp. GCM10020057]|uniref:Wadjet anti-phage system protein JetD domain-containing protein n=1 Tax=Brevibacillus sp. GCM10020057 TaxID=3317327 RepID=UPI0036397EAC
MYETFLKHLKSCKNIKISLGQLETWADPQTTYLQFHQTMQALLDNQILIPVRSSGTNVKNPPLPMTYRIQKSVLSQPIKQEIKQAQLHFHPSIRLDVYFRLAESRWRKDLPYIRQVHNYLTKQGFPQSEATAPERSFHLVGDEKWIDEKGGRKLLETIGLWEQLKIATMPDPLMFAVHLRQAAENQGAYRHLIVENKTTYYAILPILTSLPFATLIYGAGWKVVSGIDGLSEQLGVERDARHVFEYFGDLDHEGLAIWHALFQKCGAVPAVELYRALLGQEPSGGNEGQRVNKKALEHFAAFFADAESRQISALLANKEYLPQEAIPAEALRDRLLASGAGGWEENDSGT